MPEAEYFVFHLVGRAGLFVFADSAEVLPSVDIRLVRGVRYITVYHRKTSCCINKNKLILEKNCLPRLLVIYCNACVDYYLRTSYIQKEYYKPAKLIKARYQEKSWCVWWVQPFSIAYFRKCLLSLNQHSPNWEQICTHLPATINRGGGPIALQIKPQKQCRV